jgi:uncharacterized damage-inducible protein DinB
MKQYLIDTFKFNDYANKTVLQAIKKMSEPEKAVYLFSHLINSQNKWMAGIMNKPNLTEYEWFKPVYKLDELEAKWEESLNTWLNFLEGKSEDDLEQEIIYEFAKGKIGAKIIDTALQLNYHSIHHRAQIATLLRQQNIAPPFVDYIGRVLKRY